MEENRAYLIHKVLSKRSNYILFKALYNGVKPSESTFKQLGLERRTFYYALNELKENGIAMKKDGFYILSPFGYFIYSIQEKLIKWLEKENEVKNLTELINRENEKGLSYMLLKDLEEMVGLSNFEPIKVYTEWNSLSSDLALLVEAKKSIKIATRYSEPTIVNYLYKAITRGVNVEALSDRKVVAERFANLSIFGPDSDIIKVLKNILDSPNLIMKVGEVPYSFIIIDDEEIGLEIPDPTSRDGILVAFRFKSPTIAERLEEVFRELFSKGEKDPVYELLNKRVI
ncbi:MAG: hypothetical protein ACP5LF_05605 [Nitrososphaeria archaeon]